jgi:hypothetical protein
LLSSCKRNRGLRRNAIVRRRRPASSQCHVSHHADELGGTIAPMALRQRSAPRLTIALVRDQVPANHMVRTADVEDSMVS